MAGDWIKMRLDLATHPKVVRIMSATKSDKFRVVGGLHSVWAVFDQHTEDGSLFGYTPELMDITIGWSGFSDAMINVGWLVYDGAETLVMPDFDNHNGKSARRRAEDSNRKRVQRTSAICPQSVRNLSANELDKSVTREEKRREEYKSTIGASGDTPPAKFSSEYTPEFEKAWALYPKRTGSNPKKQAFSAFKARLKQGFSADEIIEGIKSYSAFCESKDQAGTEFVMQAVRFFGTGLEFQNEWQSEEDEECSDPLAGVHWI